MVQKTGVGRPGNGLPISCTSLGQGRLSWAVCQQFSRQLRHTSPVQGKRLGKGFYTQLLVDLDFHEKMEGCFSMGFRLISGLVLLLLCRRVAVYPNQGATKWLGLRVLLFAPERR